MKHKLITAAALAAAAALLSAGAAQAAPLAHVSDALGGNPTFTARTQLTGRPDSGGGGTWAYDSAYRTLSITETGYDPETGDYTYTATVTDSAASFQAIAGALTPNQGVPYTGDTITGSPSGSFSGSASYSFTADSLPANSGNLGVPLAESGAPQDQAETTSYWYEQAFPSGTVFGGSGIGDWGWWYTARIQTGPFTFVTQTWADTSSNGDGQLPADGNISGA